MAPLIFVMVWNAMVYYGSRLIMAGAPHCSMELAVDRATPFVPWTIVIYVLCYAFWVVNYILGCRSEIDDGWRMLSTDFLSKGVCLIFFLLLPTALKRPEITGKGFWDQCMRLLYIKDAPDNLFPSIHCLCSWISFIAVRSNKSIPKWYRVFSLVFALLVCVSTLTTKQHVIVDTFAGIIVAEGCYQFTKATEFYKFYEKAFDRVARLFSKTKEKV